MNHAHALWTPPSLDSLMDLVKEDIHAVHQTIWQSVHTDTPLIQELSHYIISAGGKKIRPMLTLGTAKMLDYTGTHHIDLAASIECIHTATLLHDDVVDESTLRRGNSSANEVWGNKASVLVGDFLFSKAFQLMLRPRSPDVLETLASAAARIAEGEVRQLTMSNNLQATEELYMEVILAKTARLFEAATTVSGHLTSQSPQNIIALQDFGRNLGIAFQLIDDALDYDGETCEIGKSPGDDFREQKVTLPLIYLYKRCTGDTKTFLERSIMEDQSPHDFTHAVGLLKEHDVLKDIHLLATRYAEDARQALLTFPHSLMRDSLEHVIDFCLARRR